MNLLLLRVLRKGDANLPEHGLGLSHKRNRPLIGWMPLMNHLFTVAYFLLDVDLHESKQSRWQLRNEVYRTSQGLTYLNGLAPPLYEAYLFGILGKFHE